MLKEYKLYAKTWKECARQCRQKELPESTVILLNPVDKDLHCKFKAIYDPDGGALEVLHLIQAGISLKILSDIDSSVVFLNGSGHPIAG